MTERVKKYLEFHLSRSYRQDRREVDFSLEKYKSLDENLYAAELFSACAEIEEPLFYENDIFGFNRGCVITAEDSKAWKIDNLTPNYSTLIDCGTEALKKRINAYMTVADEKQKNFYLAVLKVLDSFEKLADRYRDAAKECGKTELYEALCNVPRKAASSFYEACLYQKMIIFMLRLINPWHLTLGRFDQYMYKYFLADKEKGKTTEEFFEILELYFISLNMDTDIYGGVQQGDNGQSIVLGGYDLNGNDSFNELSELCIKASSELCLIDPKINLRVSKKTPRERYRLATELTKKGLGFPQYSNDDIVIPALIKLGYAPEDAANYSIAACWEFIIPGKGLDVPNAENICVPRHVNNAIIKSLKTSDTFEELLKAAEDEIEGYIEVMIEDKRINRSYTVFQSHPFLSLMIDGCIEQGTDLKYVKGCYRNFGCHSTGLSVAADALAAVKKVIYEDKTVDKDRLLTALKTDYENDPELRNLLISCPKVGNDDDYADSL
ncbi:MAG: pyruvate formate lyase family protein, partial [Clostridia bacterium]|nr:pyruvate formate lyase family protein [Clostridia bacterium]